MMFIEKIETTLKQIPLPTMRRISSTVTEIELWNEFFSD